MDRAQKQPEQVSGILHGYAAKPIDSYSLLQQIFVDIAEQRLVGVKLNNRAP